MSHPVSSLSNVKLLFIPTNPTTPYFQLLDQGIIKTFKLSYRKRVLRTVVSHMDDSNSAFHLKMVITVLDVVSWIKTAWNNVAVTSVKKCFTKCGIQLATLICRRNHYMKFHKNIRHLLQLLDCHMMKMESLQCCNDFQSNWELDFRKSIKVG